MTNVKSFNLFLLLILISGLLACDSRDKSKQNKSQQAQAGSKQVKPTKTWPYINESNNKKEISKNLLASNIYVVFDGSGSMSVHGCSGNLTKSDAANNALIAFSRQVPAKTNLGLMAFDQRGISERVPLAMNNRADFERAVRDVVSSGNTPLKTAIGLGVKKLTEQARKQLGYGEYHLVVVTDGVASSGENPTSIVNETLRNSPIVIHTIGFCINSQHSLNQPGRILYKRADDYKSLKAGLDSVISESNNFVITKFK